jgi:CheY-like chemotaxis protein
VKDTGIGIDESKQEIIFESFRQAEEGNSRKFDGSGLGLAIITGILEKLKGKINVTSKLGEGSLFYVTIPRNEDKFEWGDLSSDTEKNRPVKSTVRAKRIVSFEDDATSIEYLKTVVGMLGYNLVNFVDAKEGIEYLRKNNVDMILMDVQLPGMSGLEATRIIKKEFPAIPVIIQTAFAMSGDMEKAFESGCDDYISKPLSVDMLKQKIKRYVDN